MNFEWIGNIFVKISYKHVYLYINFEISIQWLEWNFVFICIDRNATKPAWLDRHIFSNIATSDIPEVVRRAL